MKNATITLSLLLLCVILGMVIYVYWPRVAEKSFEIELRQAVIDSLKDNTNTARTELRGIIEALEEVETLEELEELKNL